MTFEVFLLSLCLLLSLLSTKRLYEGMSILRTHLLLLPYYSKIHFPIVCIFCYKFYRFYYPTIGKYSF